MDEIDETEQQREAAMEIIAKAGTARSCAELLVREAGGQQTDGGLLVAHAQDHFMMATLAQELAEEIVDVYRALGETKGGSQ